MRSIKPRTAMGTPLAKRLAYWSRDDPITGCRIWEGTCGGPNKYGQLGIIEEKGKKAKMRYAHRLVWELRG